MFPTRLDSSLAYDIAKAMMDGFNRHYRLFRTDSARAKLTSDQRARSGWEKRDWQGAREEVERCRLRREPSERVRQDEPR